MPVITNVWWIYHITTPQERQKEWSCFFTRLRCPFSVASFFFRVSSFFFLSTKLTNLLFDSVHLKRPNVEIRNLNIDRKIKSMKLVFPSQSIRSEWTKHSGSGLDSPQLHSHWSANENIINYDVKCNRNEAWNNFMNRSSANVENRSTCSPWHYVTLGTMNWKRHVFEHKLMWVCK